MPGKATVMIARIVIILTAVWLCVFTYFCLKHFAFGEEWPLRYLWMGFAPALVVLPALQIKGVLTLLRWVAFCWVIGYTIYFSVRSGDPDYRIPPKQYAIAYGPVLFILLTSKCVAKE